MLIEAANDDRPLEEPSYLDILNEGFCLGQTFAIGKLLNALQTFDTVMVNKKQLFEELSNVRVKSIFDEMTTKEE